MVRDSDKSAISRSRGIPVHACTLALAFVRSLSHSSWLYVAVKPLVKPKSTAPYDVFALFVALFPKTTSALIWRQKTTLWTSFDWTQALITRGTRTTLNEDDVWNLTITMRVRPVFRKFADLKQSSLMWKVWAANSLDIICIINAVDTGSPAAHMRAYLFAALMFGAHVLKAEANVQHLWFGRRAAVRIRSQLMSAIYDKALKRRDFSGIVNTYAKDVKVDGEEGNKIKGRNRDKKAEKKEKERKEKADDPKAGADISMLVSERYSIYGAPFGIVIACTFLYPLLGWSAFAGFLVLFAGWPLNSSIAKRTIRIQKGVLAALDKRMGVLNELIGAVKFTTFFAWEDRWIALSFPVASTNSLNLVYERLGFGTSTDAMPSAYWRR
ncbi:hypothetical protein DFH11DRAFT_1545837 [Phellopilus nigrolimitatus]|nr:hypothetical protein DFH11DRAFT_1545837 [Phellopilus nigrolimitatus]